MKRDDAYISIQGVSKHFGPVVAIDHVGIDIRSGEFFSLLGASGCGKTTLLRMIAGFESPTRGEIFIDGVSMSRVPAYRRPTNMVFQNYAIFPHLSVWKNLAYGLRYDKIDKSEMEGRVGEALEMVKLAGMGGRKSHELSGGQRQRVALARALIKRPKVLLLDEPLGALDKKLRADMQIELRALQETVGITFIFVTHDQEEAMTLSDRIAVMSNGVVLQIASPRELYNRPANVEVADFIGQMNFIDASVSEVGGRAVVLETAGLGRISARAPAGADFLRAGGDVVVAVRPEKLVLSWDRKDGPGAVQGVVKAATYLGDRSHFYVTLPGREEPLVVAAAETGPGGPESLDRGSSVRVSWSDDALVLLPRSQADAAGAPVVDPAPQAKRETGAR